MSFQCRIMSPKISFASSRLPNSQASDISPVVFARHHGLRSRDERGEEAIERLDVHRLSTLAAFEEVPEAVKLGVGQRLVLGESSHGHPATVTIRQHLLFSARLLFPR
jgi:hypothetical protein